MLAYDYTGGQVINVRSKMSNYLPKGTYTVVEVQDIPDNQQKGTGHHQWLRVSCSENPKQDMTLFSGWFFLPFVNGE